MPASFVFALSRGSVVKNGGGSSFNLLRKRTKVGHASSPIMSSHSSGGGSFPGTKSNSLLSGCAAGLARALPMRRSKGLTTRQRWSGVVHISGIATRRSSARVAKEGKRDTTYGLRCDSRSPHRKQKCVWHLTPAPTNQSQSPLPLFQKQKEDSQCICEHPIDFSICTRHPGHGVEFASIYSRFTRSSSQIATSLRRFAPPYRSSSSAFSAGVPLRYRETMAEDWGSAQGVCVPCPAGRWGVVRN